MYEAKIVIKNERYNRMEEIVAGCVLDDKSYDNLSFRR